MSIQLSIRHATYEETTEIAELVNAAYRPQSDSKGWTHESALIGGERTNPEKVEKAIENSVILVGLHGSRIVACVQIERKEMQAYIGMLAVDPDAQAGGIGKTMLSKAEDYACNVMGLELLVMLVVSAREELLRFYLRRGYRDSGQKLPYPIKSGVGLPVDERLELTVLHKHCKALTG